jgi:hypothetical protein
MLHPAFRRLRRTLCLADFLLLDEVERDASQDGEVLRTVAAADAAAVLVERHVEHREPAVLDAPVRPHLGVELAAASACRLLT